MQRRAFICGLSGLALTPAERDFLGQTRPAGLILFARNVQSPDQVRRLIADAKAAAGGDGRMLVMVDQEGGRVQRLREPHWPRYPAARAFSKLQRDDRENAKEAAYLCARLMAHDLHELGFNTTCAPVLDVPVPGADNIIGDRAYAEETHAVIELAGAVAEGLIASGILPVMKHIPGHGRAMADSHLALPVVDTPLPELDAHDFVTFRALRHIPMAMTAHVVFTAVDPSAPVTTSGKAIAEVIRGRIGFDGLLMSDDLSMRALSGTLGGTRPRLVRGGLRSRAPLQWQSGRDGGRGSSRALSRGRGAEALRRRARAAARAASLRPRGGGAGAFGFAGGLLKTALPMVRRAHHEVEIARASS